MKKSVLAGLFAAFALFGGAQAQDQALVVTACGTVPFTYPAGQVRMPTVDTTGKLCLSASSAPPSGAAGGALSGTYPNPTLATAQPDPHTWAAAQTINLNAAAAPTPISGTALQVVGADSTVGRVQSVSFGAIASFSASRANGTGAAPTAVLSGDQIGGVNAYSYVTTASAGFVGPVASVQTFATQNHTTAANGSKIVLATIPNGSTTLTTGLTVDQDQSVAMAGRATAATSLAIGGATISTDALAWTGTATGSGLLNAASFQPTSTTPPTTGVYLNAAGVIGFATSSTARFLIGTTSFASVNTSGPALINAAASSTAPTYLPNRSDATTGIGANSTGAIDFIAAGASIARVTATAFTQIAGQTVLKSYTVGTLPTGIANGVAAVTDQLTACVVPGAALTGGGAVRCPVFFNGSAWVGM